MAELMPGASPLMAELEARLLQQELVASFGLFALREDRLDITMQRACEVAARGLDTRHAKVLLYRPEQDDLLLAFGVGWNPGVVGHVILQADLASPAGYALKTGQPVVSNQLTSEDRFRTPAVLVEHGIHRAINVLIEGCGAQPCGVLEADSKDRQAFTVHDIAFLQALANILTAAEDRRAREAVREDLLRDKDVLMQEVHHRVKNSLQLVQTMLQLQARGVAGAERDRLNDAASRILTIAAVHRRLHDEGVVDQTDAETYLGGLMADIGASLTPDAALRPIELNVEPVQLTPDQLTPLGLITTELVTNALKYGAGRVAVTVRQVESLLEVTVEDEGAGFPADFDETGRGSLGLRLIAALAKTPHPFTVDRSVPFGRVTVRVTLPRPRA